VHVLEGEHERLALGELLGPAQRRPGQVVGRGLPIGERENAECGGKQVGNGVALAADAQLVESLRGGVVVGDSGGRLDHRRKRPVADALPIGQRAP